MKVEWISKPWEHFEVKGFVSSEELSTLRDYFETLSIPDGVTPLESIEGKQYQMDGIPDVTKYRHNLCIHPGNWRSDPITKMLCERFIELLNMVHEWNTKYEIHVEYDRIYPGFEGKIHNDYHTKVLAFILHVSEQGHGTRLYENYDGSGNKRTIKWIPGGGGGFFGSRNTSHHRFDTLDDSTVRNTVMLTCRKKENNL